MTMHPGSAPRGHRARRIAVLVIACLVWATAAGYVFGKQYGDLGNGVDVIFMAWVGGLATAGVAFALTQLLHKAADRRSRE